MLGTDGIAADILASARLMASVFRDARADQDLISPGAMLEMAITQRRPRHGHGERLGSLEVGKKADIVLHDTDLPEWGPVFDAPTQLALAAPSSGVHSVWIDGEQVLDAGRSTHARRGEDPGRRAPGRPRVDRPDRAAQPHRMAGWSDRWRPASRRPRWRAAMGCFPSGVTIVTSWDEVEPVGSTINAFCSVSLDPPLLLICLAHENPIRAALERSRHVRRQHPARGWPPHRAALRHASRSPTVSASSPIAPRQAARRSWRPRPVFIDCAFENIYPGGDHIIAVGRGVRIEHTSAASPLLYHRGQFPDACDPRPPEPASGNGKRSCAYGQVCPRAPVLAFG